MPDAPDVPLDLTAALATRYVIERELGRGGMATVYLAEDRKHHRKVAVKALRPDLAAQLGAERFLREIGIAARLTHPHILPLIDSGEAAGMLYYVMPYVPGESLRDRLMRQPRLPVRDALRAARDVGAALDYAHRQGFIHRDIKPENILFVDGHATVADFGIARALSAAGVEPVTETGLALGTPAYMSPEQASAERELDVRSDLYSLACVLFEMLAGEPPFTGPHARAIIARQVTEHPRPVRALRPDTPPAVEQAIARALAKDPEDRFPTVAQFIEALETGEGPRPEAALLGTTRSLAVLPFANVSPDPETDYFSDGITEELINALTKVGGLRVASRTSVFALKNTPQDVRAIGALLGVSAVLEGSVRKAGDQLRITARFTAADDGRHLWSERYDRKLDDVFAIQDEIARTIVSTLRTTFLAEVADPTPRRYTENLAAYGLYLRGRYSWNKRSAEGVREAITYFEQAIAVDPKYALAYSGLSDAYALQVDYRRVPVTEGLTRAREYAQQALALDDTLAEAHTSLGWVLFIYDWDWHGAARTFRRAAELNPGYATARQWYSFVLVALGRLDQALVEGHAALELDPASHSIRRSVGWLYYYARRYDTALEHLRRAIAMNPTSQETYRLLGIALTQQGAYDAAERALREAVAIPEESAYAAAGLGYLLAVRGDRRAAETILAELEVRARSEYVSPVAVHMIHLGLGNKDQAFAWLERAHAERRGWLAYLKVEPMLDPLRSDPRFGEFVQRMKL
jgi:serine/threonine protein kinase/Flp pilus assembly protein TadD